MKTVVRTLLTLSVFAAAAFAVDTQYKTRLITSATLTIHVKDGQFITIRNFTQDKDVGQPRGAIMAGVIPSTPTPTPTATATATPTLSTTAGPGVALSTGDKLTDSATLFGDTNPTGTITFNLLDPSLVLVYTDIVTVSGNGTYSTASGNNPGGFLPTVTGTYTWSALYSGDSNNSAAIDNMQNESEIVTATPTPAPTPTATPTPIFTALLTAAILNPPPAEFIKPIIIAGPATLTIDPVPGATLSITYRKSLQPIQPTPTPTPSIAIVINGATVTPTPSSALSVGTSTTTSHSTVATESLMSDEDEAFSSSPTPTSTATPTRTPSSQLPTPTPTPTATPSITPTPLPTPTA